MSTNTTQPNRPTTSPHGTPRPVDVHVGHRLRTCRTLIGMSQENLGTAVGLTFQQIQKYERGANRIGASRLYQFANVMDVPVSYFFDDMPEQVQHTRGAYAADLNKNQDIAKQLGAHVLHNRKTLELARNFHAIPSEKIQSRAFELIKALAKTTDA